MFSSEDIDRTWLDSNIMIYETGWSLLPQHDSVQGRTGEREFLPEKKPVRRDIVVQCWGVVRYVARRALDDAVAPKSKNGQDFQKSGDEVFAALGQ